MTKRPNAINLGSIANLIVAPTSSLKLRRARAVCNEVVSRCNTRLAVDKPSHRTVYCLHQQRTFRDRAARGSVHLRKMVCRAVAGINIVWRSKVIDAR